MNGIAALFAREILNRLEKRVRNLGIVDEIQLRKAHSVRMPFLIRAVIQNRAHAPDNLAVLLREKRLHIAIRKRGILFGIPVAAIVRGKRRHILGNVLVEPVREIGEYSRSRSVLTSRIVIILHRVLLRVIYEDTDSQYITFMHRLSSTKADRRLPSVRQIVPAALYFTTPFWRITFAYSAVSPVCDHRIALFLPFHRIQIARFALVFAPG